MSGGSEVIKSDYMLKRSQMRGKFKTENYKNRWFQLTSTVLRYCDGSIEVHQDSSHFNTNYIVLFSVIDIIILLLLRLLLFLPEISIISVRIKTMRVSLTCLFNCIKGQGNSLERESILT